MVKKIVKNALSGTSLEEDYEGPSRQNLLPDQLKDQITYPNVHALASDYKLVSQSEASAYFPKDADPIKVNVGVSTKSNIEIPVRDSVCLDTYMDYKKSFILNTGGAIWSLDFCPKVPSKDSHPNIHYLAVAGYRSPDPERYPIDVYQPTGTYLNCIQIWRFDLSLRGAQRQPVLDMCLLHDYGIVIDAKWCPYGAYEEAVESTDPNVLPKLGILAAAFGDSLPRMMVVPHPVAMRELLGVEDSETLYLQIKEARCTFNLPGINPTAISWGGHSRISCGSSSGNVIIWDAEGALANGLEQDDKLGQSERMIFNAIVHDSAVNGIVWHGRINPIEYATSSLDGNLKICNTRDPNISITIMRVRALMYPPVWPQYSTNICVCDADNCLQTMYLANESNFKITLRHFDSIGKVWEMAASESHTFLAASSADGLVRICNIHQRRRKGLPHTQRVIYAVLYDKDTNTYSYVDGVRRLECDFSKFLPTSNRFVESNYLISKVTWNPNNIASPWLASGSVAGICRVDFCGVGHQWLED